MKILISNDDGILAPGIAALVKAFAGAGHEVFVCAPDSQRSAASHSLTIGRKLTAREIAMDGAAKAYAISGTPADCVKLGLTVLCPEAEAVVSGVNHGLNFGTDVLYSGTVAAAMEGAICGRPAMAVSQTDRRVGYDTAAALAVQLFETMTAHPIPPLSVLNLNCPEQEEIRGVVAARLGQLHYTESYVPEAPGSMTYVLSGEVDQGRLQSEDYTRLMQGYATVTVVRADMTDHAATEAWEALI